MSLRNSVVAILRIGVGALFLLAGAFKGANIGKFEGEIRLYYMVPVFAIPFMAAVIIVLECMAGLAFVVGRGVREAAFVLGALCAGFLIALIARIVGGVPGECGCFGGMIVEAIGPAAVARDVILLIICITIGIVQKRPGPRR